MQDFFFAKCQHLEYLPLPKYVGWFCYNNEILQVVTAAKSKRVGGGPHELWLGDLLLVPRVPLVPSVSAVV